MKCHFLNKMIFNDTVYICFILQIQSYIIIHISSTLHSITNIMLLSHSENIWAISQRNGLYICTHLLLKIDYVLIGSK